MSDLVSERVETFLWQPPARFANGIGKFSLPVLRILYSVIRDIAAGQLTLRAMSLVYTTLLSIVPLIAFSFSMLKGFGFHRQLEPLLHSVLEPLGEKGVELTDQVIGFVDNVSGGLLGGVGLLMLVYTVISTIQKVEGSFNYIWNVAHSRSLVRRFSDYLSVVLVGPLIMVAAIAMIGSIEAHSIVQRLSKIEPFGTAILVSGELAPVVLLTVLFTFVYSFITNTRVRLLPAFVGGASAGILWAVAGKLFATFVAGSTNYAAIYSSFAIVITALIWLYVSWLILLLGSQIAYYVQHPECMRARLSKTILPGRQRDAMALELMLNVGGRFLSGMSREDEKELSESVGVPNGGLSPIVESLERARLLTQTQDGCLMPARDLAAIQLKDIFDAMYCPSDVAPISNRRSHAKVESLLDEVQSAVHESLRNQTLRDLLKDEPLDR